MSLGHGSKIVRDGLQFQYDIENTKSWKGKPTTNLIADVIDTTFETTTGLSQMSPISVTDEITFNKRKVYKVTHDGGSSGFNITSNTHVPDNTVITMSMWVYIPGNQTFDRTWEIHRHSLPDGVCVNGDCHWYSTVDDSQRFWGQSSPRNVWFRRSTVIRTSSNTGAVNGHRMRIFAYTGGTGTENTFFYVAQPQIEVGDTVSRFADGTRSNTQALLDISGRGKQVTASSLSYTSDDTFVFDGTDDQMAINDLKLNPTAFTISAFVKIPTAGNYNKSILSAGNTSTAGFWFLKHREGLGGRLVFHGWDGVNPRIDTQTNIVVPDDQPCHVGVTYGGGVYKLFINGVQDGPDFVKNPISVDGMTAIRVGQGASSHVAGSIYNLAIYNRELSESEMFANFSASRKRYGI